ncbi:MULTISPECIES: ParA family protein [Bradyrhizobium]|uniref:ParA family protein n=1 Tax=Bradyrhizobium vignae TaxID=1549949 RepID=A0ABS4A536_9BRAD|nr:ParA family protein [Bradyrhizobium vignae]MBP0115396.1 ParA family protein [Bradyrhizobium vignae]
MKRASLLATVAFVGKGGSGKSTTALNIAVLARMADFKVGVIDADLQQSAFVWRCVRESNDIPVCRCGPGSLDDTIEAARRAGLQFLVIDMPPALRHVPAVAHRVDLTVVAMRPTLFDLRVTRTAIQLLQSEGARYAVIFNAAPPYRGTCASPMVRDARQALADIGSRLWPHQITHRLSVPYSTVRGAGVAEVEPEGHAAAEYRALWRAICRDLRLDGGANEEA